MTMVVIVKAQIVAALAHLGAAEVNRRALLKKLMSLTL